MKKLLALLLAVLVLTSSVNGVAEQYKAYSAEELLQKMSELIAQLSEVTAAYGAVMKEQQLSEVNAGSDESLGAISSLFPDESFALFVRDKLKKFSISQPVTQAELDTITAVAGSEHDNYQIVDLTGISLLRNVTHIDVSWLDDCLLLPDEICQLKHLEVLRMSFTGVVSLPENIGDISTLEALYARGCKMTKLPDSFTKLTSLRTVDFCYSDLESLPEDMSGLISMKSLSLTGSKIKQLPDSICSLTRLSELFVGETSISSLPSNIGNLVNLEKLDISKTNISVLPESIWGLKLDYLNMSGTSIK